MTATSTVENAVGAPDEHYNMRDEWGLFSRSAASEPGLGTKLCFGQ